MSGDEREPAVAAAEEDARFRPLGDDLRALAASGIAYAKAEAEVQKARAAYAAGSIKSIVLFGVLAAVLAFFALVALTVGLVFALTPILTALGATAAVFVGLLVIAAICGLIASKKWKAMMAMIIPAEGKA